MLERIEFYDILMDFKNESELVRKASIKLAFRRAVLSTACARREGSMQGKFSGLTNYLAKNIVDPGKHNENETLLSDNHMMHIEDRPGRVIHDMIQKSEARLDLHLKTMQEELAQQLLASAKITHDFVTTETVCEKRIYICLVFSLTFSPFYLLTPNSTGWCESLISFLRS